MEPASGLLKFGVAPAASGGKTLFFEREGKRRYLYSRYDPGRDGFLFRDDHPVGGCGLLVFVGLGLGYHVRPFLEDPGIEEIAVLEPCTELFEAVGGTEEIRSLATDPRVSIYPGPAAEAFADKLAARYDALVRGSVRVLSFPPLCATFPSVYRDLEDRVRSRLDALSGDGVTIGRFARLWLGNFTSNAREAGSCYPVSSLFGGSGGAAVVTGAGPSLDCVRTLIEAFRERFYLISTDAAVKPLARGGILPDLIVSIDPQPVVRFHFQGIDPGALVSVPAVLSLLSCPAVFGAFGERYLVFTHHPTTGLFDSTRLLEEGAVLNFRSVGSYALKVAFGMGFETILLAGFDFSFPRFRVYAKDTFFHHAGIARWSRFATHLGMEAGAMRGRGAVPVRDVGGEALLLTSRILGEYASEFEMVAGEARARGVRILRLGMSGARLKGVESVEDSRIEEFFRKIESKPRPPSRNTPKKRALVPDPGRWGSVRPDLVLTLALRHRIFQGAQSGEAALERAEKALARGAEKKMGLSQV
jgi:hypothetical protein